MDMQYNLLKGVCGFVKLEFCQHLTNDFPLSNWQKYNSNRKVRVEVLQMFFKGGKYVMHFLYYIGDDMNGLMRSCG